MAEEKDQTGASWEDLPLPDEFPEPHTEDRTAADEVARDGAFTTTITGESTKVQSEQCSPNLLEMLKAAESRWAPRDKNRTSEPVTEELVAEAQKTDMVSKDTDQHLINTHLCADPQEA